MTASRTRRTRRTRQPELRVFTGDFIDVDNFAGGGGASTAIEMALGRSPDLACNHNAEALAMHKANHPSTEHLCEDILKVSPREVCQGRRVRLAWFSPDCKHFSKAKGGKPVSKRIRGLAWMVVRWAREVAPEVICLENVEEFEDWGPLLPDGKPNPELRGMTFRRWRRELESLGYAIEHRHLVACDYGAPTSRKRLFLVARRDGKPIQWPVPTHGPGRKPYRTAAECIDWSVPCPSIFGRKEPLVENTCRRIARGIQRFVLEAAEPFIIPVTHHGDRRVHSLRGQMPTITGAHRGEHALIVPTLIQTGFGERKGQDPRVPGLHKPLGTVVAQGIKHAVVEAHLQRAELVAAFMAQHNTGMVGHPMLKPLSTSVSKVGPQALVTAALKKLDAQLPLFFRREGQKADEVHAFLVKYYGNEKGGLSLRDPLDTAPTRDRFALITVYVAGEPYIIVDIGMRMLRPRELFTAQGFPASYVIDGIQYMGRDARGRPQVKTITKTGQVRMVGNSVSPFPAAALLRAQFPDVAVESSQEAA